MHRRENFEYKNRKYVDKVGSNPVLVIQHPEVQSLYMAPRVNIIEDMQLRKALPKSYKMFKSEAPFSQNLGNIVDGLKFMSALSSDMLKTTASREAKLFTNDNSVKVPVKVANKEKEQRLETLVEED